MGFFGAERIDEQLLRCGAVNVSVGAVTVKGLVDVVDESLVTDSVSDLQGQSVVVTVKTGAIAGLSPGQTLIADGVTYRVMRTGQIDDGALTVIHVARSS